MNRCSRDCFPYPGIPGKNGREAVAFKHLQFPRYLKSRLLRESARR